MKLEGKPTKAIAIIHTYYGGNWAKTRIEKAVIELKYFKNGNVKHTDFNVIKTLEVIEKGYQPKNSRASSTIHNIVSIIED